MSDMTDYFYLQKSSYTQALLYVNHFTLPWFCHLPSSGREKNLCGTESCEMILLSLSPSRLRRLTHRASSFLLTSPVLLWAWDIFPSRQGCELSHQTAQQQRIEILGGYDGNFWKKPARCALVSQNCFWNDCSILCEWTRTCGIERIFRRRVSLQKRLPCSWMRKLLGEIDVATIIKAFTSRQWKIYFKLWNHITSANLF